MNTAPKMNGRPRVLHLDEVLDAAIDLGLGGLSMTALAAKLNVATATIYNYVASREDLMRRAVGRQMDRLAFDDIGGDWQSLIRGHARRYFDHYSAEPQMIVQHMRGMIPLDVNFDYLEALLAALVKRGLTVTASYQLYTAANCIVGGAIVRAAHLRTLQTRGESPAEIIRASLAARAPGELPYLRACAVAMQDERGSAWEQALERLMDGFAREISLAGSSSG